MEQETKEFLVDSKYQKVLRETIGRMSKNVEAKAKSYYLKEPLRQIETIQQKDYIKKSMRNMNWRKKRSEKRGNNYELMWNFERESW